MSNSVVKVADSTLNDSLLLLVGEDGTITPSKDVVEAYLSSRSDATNLQLMHINKTDDKSIEVAVNNMLYVRDSEGSVTEDTNFNEVAYNLYNVKLDHDYTCAYEPVEEVDELAKTLSLLDGDTEGTEFNIAKPLITTDVVNALPRQVSVPKAKATNAHKKSVSALHPKKVKVQDGEDLNKSLNEEEYEYESKQKTPKKSDVRPKEALAKLPKQAESPKVEKSQEADKKAAKKEKKVQKAVPDDFALFSTPDIIRRVGGKEPPPLLSPTSEASKPARIEVRSKSVSDSTSILKNQGRLSLDGKVTDKQPPKSESKKTENRRPVDHSLKKPSDLMSPNVEGASAVSSVPLMQESEEAKAFGGALPAEVADLEGGEQGMTLDGNGLELDPALLDNINNDLISEDILYQVAQSLVSNTELQHAIDKSLKEDGLALQAVSEGLDPKQLLSGPSTDTEQITPPNSSQKGTQIVRPDGRIVVIPPIERPTTRSRNKRTPEDTPSPKFITRKPLDEEHVSGNELDSSDEEEEESEDDPNKLWCICNQPHNNRFMICCDTCEEWYHGKCVNITKAMGQQMESEGREWICLFCKDPLLRRPQAAAKRIRKASRNSRQSSDSGSSTKTPEAKAVPCVVCHKPSRSNSIFCSEACILMHAQGVERVVVFERATGNMLTGNKAPSAANLEEWLKQHPGYEVVRSAGKIVTTKAHQATQSKLKLIKAFGSDPEAVAAKSKNLSGVAKTVPKTPQQVKPVSAMKSAPSGIKIIRQIQLTPAREKSQQGGSSSSSSVSSPVKKIVQTPVKSSSSANVKERPTPVKVVKVRPAEHASPSAPPAKQENIRENVQKTIFEQLTNRLKVADDLKLSEDELKSISTEIESQLYKCFGDTGQKYRNKYRSLIFNIKDIKNQTLWRRICEKSVNPYQLVRLSPDDLASQELALWREREAKHQLDMIKKSELELLKCNRQYVLKTHKGEQILEDNHPKEHIDNTEVITGLTEASNGEKSDRKRDTSRDSEKKSSKHSHRDKDRRSSKDKSNKGHHAHRSSSRDHTRKRSRSRDKNSKHGERRRSRSRGRDRHRRSSHKSSRHKKGSHRGSSTDKLDKKSKEILEQLVDNKIVPPLEDRLWKHVPQEDILPAPLVESDSDHEPTSTVTIPTPPRSNEVDEAMSNPVAIENKNDQLNGKEQAETDNVPASPQPPQTKSDEIWRGVINMIDVAQISITAHEVSGDCGGLSSELPANLDIVGRISPDTVWDYIGKMKCSNSKIISIVRLNAINVEEKMPYLALYSYLSSRNRLGVVKSTNKAVKDFYILPLASQKPIPQALLPLNGPGFEEARPALLLGIIVRDKRKRPYIDPLPSVTNVKKVKVELTTIAPPARSYTPPPMKDSRLSLLLPPTGSDQDGDEPYSPEDSDPDNMTPSTSETVPKNPSLSDTEVKSPPQPFQPFTSKFDDIPGLDNASLPLPSSTQEIQRQMEKLNKEIEMQKSEINSISQNIATASTEIGTAAFADIALPSNLQQILDRIKTIGSTPGAEAVDAKPQAPPESADFTIPLILPTSFSRASPTVNPTPDNTIPLNLPVKKKPGSGGDKSGGVLSSLTEEDLIRKAEEMLKDTKSPKEQSSSSSQKPTAESKQPPIPGLEDSQI